MNQINNKELKKFGFILATILAIFGLIHLMKGHKTVSNWFLCFSAVFFTCSVFFIRLVFPVYIVFSMIAYVSGWFNTRLILCIIFYVLVTPIGLLMRLLGKDPLEKKMDRKKDSYWQEKEAASLDVSRYEKPF